jgi:hypothetical protein
MKTNTRKPSNRAEATKHTPMRRTKPASQTTPTKKSAPTKSPAKAYILLGADEYAKPRAARFSGEDPALLAKAAEAMHLRLVEITEPDVAEIAALLPPGRLHANGKGLVPYVKGEVYSELMCAALTTLPPPGNDRRESSCAPCRLAGWRGSTLRLRCRGLGRRRSGKRSQFSSANITVMMRTRSVWPARSGDLAGRS